MAVVLALAALAGIGHAQEPLPVPATDEPVVAGQPAAETPGAFEAKMEEFKALGLPDKEAFVMALLSLSDEMDMAQLLPYLMLMQPGGGEGDLAGIMLFMNMLGKGSTAGGPVALTQGENILLVIERGKVYKIDTVNMKLLGEVAYRPSARLDLGKFLTSQIAREARAKAERSSCMSNLKQIALAVMMYAQDNNETLPPEDWVPALRPYLMNDRIFACPTRPHQPVGYAFNKSLLRTPLHKIQNPAETIMLFESKLADDSPVGSAEDVPVEGVHEGGICVAFADGHVEWLNVNEARERLK